MVQSTWKTSEGQGGSRKVTSFHHNLNPSLLPQPSSGKSHSSTQGAVRTITARGSVGPAKTILTKPLDGEEFRILGHQMVDFITDYYQNIETFPVQGLVQPGYLKKLLPESAPKRQESVEDIFNDVHSKIMPGITHWQSPKFFGYYPSNTSTASILGEMLSASLSVVGFSWITFSAATELEIIVLDWLAKLLQLPNEFFPSSKGGGVIQGTACEAVLVVMLAARKRALMKVSLEQGISEAEALGKRGLEVLTTAKSTKLSPVNDNLVE